MEKTFKFATEGTVVMFLSRYQILQQQEIDEFLSNQKVFDKDNQCNIYFVLKRPRITINPKYFVVTKEFIEMEFLIQVKDRQVKRVFRLKNYFSEERTELTTEYPYNYFQISDGERTLKTKCAILLDNHQAKSPFEDELLDYEVLYIGQSYGTRGNLNATDRIISHSTLQKIYLDNNTYSPDTEIWIMLCSFSQKNIAGINGSIKALENEPSIEVDRHMKFSHIQFSEKQKINFTEAALIRTFQPKYNKEFKESFPSKKHSDYNDCYKADINGIVVETELSSINRWLYTESKPRNSSSDFFNYWQSGHFHFIDEQDRYKMFNNEFI